MTPTPWFSEDGEVTSLISCSRVGIELYRRSRTGGNGMIRLAAALTLSISHYHDVKLFLIKKRTRYWSLTIQIDVEYKPGFVVCVGDKLDFSNRAVIYPTRDRSQIVPKDSLWFLERNENQELLRTR